MSGEMLATWGQELMAYSLRAQGRGQEALDWVRAEAPANVVASRRLMRAQLMAEQGRWQPAISELLPLAELDAADPMRRQASDWLLRAADHYARGEDWAQMTQCLAQARHLCPDNPSFVHLPKGLEDRLPLVAFLAGDYQAAVEQFEHNLRQEGPAPERLHRAAIACQCLLENAPEMEVWLEAWALHRSFTYWVALARRQDYWERLFDERQALYGAEMSRAKFVEIAAEAGMARCEARLNHLQGKLELIPGSKGLDLVQDTRLAMLVERYSAELLADLWAQTSLTGYTGGLEMLKLLLGEDGRETHLARLEQDLGNRMKAAGSKGWLLQGLRGPASAEAYILYLQGDYGACYRACLGRRDDLQMLLCLALEKKAETDLAAGRVGACEELAEGLGKITFPDILAKVAKALDEMGATRAKALARQGQPDEAVQFIIALLGKAGKQASLPKLRETLVGIVLQRSEARYDAGDIDGFLREFDLACQWSADNSATDGFLRKIIRYHANKAVKEERFSDGAKFLDRMQRRFPGKKFIDTQLYLIKALEALKRAKDVSDSSVIGWLEKAHDASPDDQEARQLYSLGLSNKAVNILNRAAESRDLYGIRRAVEEADGLLDKALRIDGSNSHARKNKVELLQLRMKLMGF